VNLSAQPALRPPARGTDHDSRRNRERLTDAIAAAEALRARKSRSDTDHRGNRARSAVGGAIASGCICRGSRAIVIRDSPLVGLVRLSEQIHPALDSAAEAQSGFARTRWRAKTAAS